MKIKKTPVVFLSAGCLRIYSALIFNTFFIPSVILHHYYSSMSVYSFKSNNCHSILYTYSMIRLEKKYEQAIEFRKRGFTYSEIAKIVAVSKSTVSIWLSKKAFSKKVKEDNLKRSAKDNVKRISLINKARASERKRMYADAIRNAETEYVHYKKDALFIAGLMIYVGEGDHKDKRLIRMTNVRMDLHLIFLKFLTGYLGVEKAKIRFWLLLYPDLVETTCMKRWSKYLGLPVSQFYKNQVIEGRGKKRTLHNGVGNIIIGNTVLKIKLSRWIELSTKELQK